MLRWVKNCRALPDEAHNKARLRISFGGRSRVDWIRTSDPLHPMQVRYRAAPPPEFLRKLFCQFLVATAIVLLNQRPSRPCRDTLPGCATTRNWAANLWNSIQFDQPSLVCKIIMTTERRNRIENVLKKRQNDLTVVLENVFDPHNISAVMRSCDAVGIEEIYVLNTRIPLHKKWGARSSSSAAKWLTIHQFDQADACFAALRKRYSTILTTHLSTDAVSLYEVDLTKSIALVFGNEHAGVSEEIRQMADGNFIIPQVGMIQSLNISVACAVSLYEAFRQKTVAGHYHEQKLTSSEYASLSKQWGMYEETTGL